MFDSCSVHVIKSITLKLTRQNFEVCGFVRPLHEWVIYVIGSKTLALPYCVTFLLLPICMNSKISRIYWFWEDKYKIQYMDPHVLCPIVVDNNFSP